MTHPANRRSLKRMFQVSLPPGVIGLRSLFEDERTLAPTRNPVKWEDPISSIGDSDGFLNDRVGSPMNSGDSRGKRWRSGQFLSIDVIKEMGVARLFWSTEKAASARMQGEVQ